MFTCRNCVRYSLQAIIGDAAIQTPAARSTWARISTSLNSRNQGIRHLYIANAQDKASRNCILANTQSRQEWLDSRGTRPASNPPKEINIPSHLDVRLLKRDPLKLAQFVRDTLRQDDFDGALAVVREASRSLQCIVSWNHLIDWLLSKGRMNAAIKIYNDMKKRSQVPDARTFTIIFRGCAQQKDVGPALHNVMAMYNYMLTDKSPVKPNIIHMNSILKMCAMARDLESLLTIAASMPEKGIRAANNITFVTILNALRVDTIAYLQITRTPTKFRKNLSIEQTNHLRAITLQARHIWDDVIKRWRKGSLWIDEELVCSMGRLLLLTEGKQAADDIFTLIEQTMSIPRQLPAWGTPERSRIDPNSQGQHRVLQAPEPEFCSAKVPVSGTENSSYRLEPILTPFENAGPVENNTVLELEPFSELREDPAYTKNLKSDVDPKYKGHPVYAKPGRNSLSLLLDAILILNVKEPATKYWKILTSTHNVQPDQNNYVSYLRILRVFRASTETIQLLLKMPQQDMEPKVFRIAMSSCVRDTKNPHVFSNAGKILDMMQETLREPDIPSLIKYLEVAIDAPGYIKTPGSDKLETSPTAHGKQILRALDRLNPSFLNLKSILFFKDPNYKSNAPAEAEKKVADTRVLVQKMIRAYDVMMNRGLVFRDMRQSLTAERSKLASLLGRSLPLKWAQPQKSSGKSDASK